MKVFKSLNKPLGDFMKRRLFCNCACFKLEQLYIFLKFANGGSWLAMRNFLIVQYFIFGSFVNGWLKLFN